MRVSSSDLGEYLRARRNVTQPEDVGLTRGEGRRVPGLRRDEVASRAAISPEYYLRLEQGKVGAPSARVLHALADALLLDDVARVYLMRLASGLPREFPRATAAQIDAVMAQWDGTPAYLTDQNRDVVASNDLNQLMTGGRQVPGLNMLAEIFDPALSVLADAEWTSLRRAAVGSFRFDTDLHAPRARQIVSDLLNQRVFAEIWERHEVAVPTAYDIGAIVPGMDAIPIRVHNLRLPSLPGHQLTVYSAEPGSTGDQWFARLRAESRMAA